MIKKIGIILLLIPVLFMFFFINKENYKKQKEIEYTFVEHPENLMSPEFAKHSTFGFANLRADLLWLQIVQYIGGNALDSAYKKYLYAMIEIITELNPYFERPYTIGMLLLPSYSDRYESLSEEEQANNIEQARILGHKGLENFCDMEKVAKISEEFNLEKIWTDEAYTNPCKSDMIPYSLAYVYYYYLHQPLEAAKYYKVASAVEGSIEGAKVMSAIMQGKGGDREKSIFMFLNMGQYIENDPICNQYSEELQQVFIALTQQKLALSGEMIKQINITRENAFGTFSEETGMDDAKCQNYANKATRELNLLYIEKFNELYKAENDGKSAGTAKILFDAGIIDYLPVDFQTDDTNHIMYYYNEDTGKFDYQHGQY